MAQGRPSPFSRRLSDISLTKRFAIVSFAILLTGMLIIGWWVTRQIERGVMSRTAAVTASFVTSSVSPHLQNLGETGELRPEEIEALDRLLFETELGQRIVSFKVWSRNGRILYSPQTELVGMTFQVGRALQGALLGETVSHISDLSEPENDYERQYFSQLQETYTPLRLFGTGEIKGAVEFYEATDALTAEIQAARLRSWFVVGGATLVMYLVLVGMVKGASLTIGRQRHELARVAAQQELDRMKTEFISTVSHELRTPLGFIKGYATTLLREDISVDASTSKEFLQVIAEESSKLQVMIDDLLDASRIQAGRLEINRRAISLKELLESALHKISPDLHDRGYALVTELDSARTSVLVDPVRIEQVLRNLLENAARYSDPGSTIRVSVAGQDGKAVISVSDHGYGIAAYEQKKIFQAFYRGESSQRKSVHGAGLGLSICMGIIESHDGELWVESNPNAGSTFRFTLPLTNGLVDQATDSENPSASPDEGGAE